MSPAHAKDFNKLVREVAKTSAHFDYVIRKSLKYGGSLRIFYQQGYYSVVQFYKFLSMEKKKKMTSVQICRREKFEISSYF